MAELPTRCLFWFILCILFTDAIAADALIQAPNKITLGDTVLNITCSVSSPSSLKRIYSLTLLRNNSNTSPSLTVIALMDNEAEGAKILNDANLESRASISGTIATPSTAQLKLSIPASSTKCTDAVSYECKVIGLTTTDNTETYTKDRKVEVEVKPTSTDDIIVSPASITNDKYLFKPGTIVTLNCTGNVGNPAKLHRWCKKGANDQAFVSYPNSAHINQEVTLYYRSDTCDYRRTSQLTYNMTTQDTTIRFMCEDSTNNSCGSGLFAKQVALKTYVADMTTTGLTDLADMTTIGSTANTADALIAAPNKITLGDTVLNITCSVSSPSSLDKVYSIILLRNNSNTSPTWTVIADVDSDGSTIKNDIDLQNRATLTGTVENPSTAQLKLSVPASSTKCTDAVSYQCKVLAVLKTTGGTETYQKDRNVQVEVKPTSTDDISVSPASITNDKYSFKPGTIVTLNCTGNVGNPAKLHRWCKKGVNDQGFMGYPNSAHINQEVTLYYRSDTCDYRRTSQLNYNMTTQDTTIGFMCEDSTNNSCGSGLFAKQVALETYMADMTTTGSTDLADMTTIGSTANTADALIAAPNKITLGDTVLNITCSVSSPSSLDKVYSIILLRNNSNTSPTWTVIADVDSDGSAIKNDIDLQNRATLTGTVENPSTAQLKLSVPASSTKCTDAVSYQCKVLAVLKTTGGTETYQKDRNVQVKVKPTSTDDISVSPASIKNDKYSFKPGTIVTLNCTGNVGNPAKLHRWCKKGVNDQGFMGYPNSAHINQEVTLYYRSDTCDYRRTSQLNYNMTTQDTTIGFMCEDSTNNSCGSGLFAKQVALEAYMADMTTTGSTDLADMTTIGSTGQDQKKEEKCRTEHPNTISIVLISIATVLFVICFIYAVWNCINKRRLKS